MQCFSETVITLQQQLSLYIQFSTTQYIILQMSTNLHGLNSYFHLNKLTQNIPGKKESQKPNNLPVHQCIFKQWCHGVDVIFAHLTDVLKHE